MVEPGIDQKSKTLTTRTRGLSQTRQEGAWICHILCTNCLLEHVIEGKTEGRIEVMEGLGGRCMQLLVDLKERRACWELKVEALGRSA
jgi:hypothetical protein